MAYAAKTLPTECKVTEFLASLDSPDRKEESLKLLDLMQRLSGEPAVLWGPSIVGFGEYGYTYDSGHSGRSMRIGFSPRKGAMTVYIVPGFDEMGALLARLGPHTLGKSCLYIKDLSKVDTKVLEEIISLSLKEMAGRYPRSDLPDYSSR